MKNNSDTILYLAPLQGFTDSVYRQAFVKIFYGIDLLMTPYVTADKKEIKQSSVNDLLPKNNAPHSVIPQILVNNADDFIFLANYLSDLGYNTINWNLGCPYPMVTNKTLGAGLLPHPEKVNNILEKVLPRIKCKVSIKTRIGLNNPNEIFDIIPIINHFPIEEIIIHPRIGKQLYKGATDINTFEKCLPQIKHTVVFNGDINTIEDYSALKKRFPH